MTRLGYQIPNFTYPDTGSDRLFEAIAAQAVEAESSGFDTVLLMDHFYQLPMLGDPANEMLECYTVLAALAQRTSRVRLSSLVTGNTYRNPTLLAKTVTALDIVSGGRAQLGIGAGWFERDYSEYGFEFGTARGRLDALEADLQRMRDRISQLTPAPVGRLPILIGGAGEKVTLRLVARYADAWNTFGPPESWSHKNAVLNEWCEREGRDPAAIERTVCINPDEADQLGAYVDAGAHHVIVMIGTPFDLTPVESLLAAAEALG